MTRRTVKTTRNGENMAFVMLEDKTGEIEAVVFSKQYERFSAMLLLESAVVLGGTISLRDDEPPKILVNSCDLLIENEHFEDKKTKTLYLRVPFLSSEETKKALAIIGKEKSGADVVVFDMQTQKYVKAVGYKANLSNSLFDTLEKLLGAGNVAVK